MQIHGKNGRFHSGLICTDTTVVVGLVWFVVFVLNFCDGGFQNRKFSFFGLFLQLQKSPYYQIVT